jgi:hypothetical protein
MRSINFERRYPCARQIAYGILVYIAILFAFVIFPIIAALYSPAEAHEAPTGWTYPLYCCSNRDCVMLKSERVTEGPDGFRVTLLPGDHDFVKQQTSFLVEYKSAKPSPDGAYHICISPELKMLCFFAGTRGS